jgi:hypothetical protein
MVHQQTSTTLTVSLLKENVLIIENGAFLVENVFYNGGKYTEEVIRQFMR